MLPSRRWSADVRDAKTATQPAAPAMPFGKFKGTPIPRLPGWYLAWAAKIVVAGWLKDALTEELERRAGPTAAGPTPRAKANAAPMVGHVIRPPAPGEDVPF